jgi:hypothetical protein
MHFKVTFHLDGSGVLYDPAEPIHLDDLLCWVLAPMQYPGRENLTRDAVPEGGVRLPLRSSVIHGERVWHASALFPEGPTGEDLRFWRKRFRQSRADLATGAPVIDNGTWRDWNMPLGPKLITRLSAYASGSRSDCKKLLKQVRYLGKKRAHGYGRILSMDLEETPEDWSLVKDGLAMRWLPDPDGVRMVRPAPPYWNRHGRVRCGEVGSPVGEYAIQA